MKSSKIIALKEFEPLYLLSRGCYVYLRNVRGFSTGLSLNVENLSHTS
jgi:hypothetical protein